MHVKEISYTEGRVVSTAQYENARISIGATVSIAEGEDAAAAMAHAHGIVRSALIDRLIDMEGKAREALYGDAAARTAKKYRL